MDSLKSVLLNQKKGLKTKKRESLNSKIDFDLRIGLKACLKIIINLAIIVIQNAS